MLETRSGEGAGRGTVVVAVGGGGRADKPLNSAWPGGWRQERELPWPCLGIVVPVSTDQCPRVCERALVRVRVYYTRRKALLTFFYLFIYFFHPAERYPVAERSAPSEKVTTHCQHADGFALSPTLKTVINAAGSDVWKGNVRSLWSILYMDSY